MGDAGEGGPISPDIETTLTACDTLGAAITTGRMDNPPATYPRTYRPSLWRRLIMMICPVLVMPLAGFALWMGPTFISPDSGPLLQAFIEGVLAAMLVAGAWSIAYAFRVAVVLRVDSIEARGVFHWRGMLKVDIEGYRDAEASRAHAKIKLIPKSKALKPLVINAFGVDDVFGRWFEGFANLDMRDEEAAHAKLLQEPSLGDTPEARDAALKLISRANGWMSVAGFGLCLAMGYLVRPGPWVVAFGAICPVLAVVAVGLFRGRVHLTMDQEKPRISVGGPVLGVIVGLTMVGLKVDLLRSIPLAGPILALAAGGTAASLLAEPRNLRTTWLPLIALAALGWGWSVSAAADIWLDNTTPRSVEVRVVKRHHSTDSYPTYYLDVGPWDVRTSPLTFTVSRDLYEQKPVGNTATACEHSGLLHAPWVTVGACEKP